MAEVGTPIGGVGTPVMGKDSSGNAQFMSLDANGNALVAEPGATATARLLSAANTTNSTLVKNSAGRVFSIKGQNAAAGVRWLKLYNKATAPTVGTDTPVQTLVLPASAPFSFEWRNGYSFSTGIGFGLTVNAADNDTTAVTAGDILGLNIDYA